MTRRRIWWALPLLAIAVSLFSFSTLAQSQQSPMTVTGAGGGIFPAGATFNGVSLSSLRFGTGVSLPGDGTANGTFESTLVGTTATGLARNIVLVGAPTGGSAQPGGPATYAGMCNVDSGDGTPSINGVPFTVTLSTLSNGKWGLSLKLGATQLPTASVNTGSITVK